MTKQYVSISLEEDGSSFLHDGLAFLPAQDCLSWAKDLLPVLKPGTHIFLDLGGYNWEYVVPRDHHKSPSLLLVKDLPSDPPNGVVLLCECGSEYSARKGDYFHMLPDDPLFCKDCKSNLRLARKAPTTYEEWYHSHVG